MARIKNISDFMSALMFLVDFFAQFLKKVEKLGVSAEELYEAMKSKEKRDAMAEAVAGVLKRASARTLVHLRLVKSHIHVSTPGFSKKDFFSSKLGTKIWTSGDFDRIIMSELSDTILAFEGDVDSLELTKNMYDSEIRPEIGKHDVRTADEAVAILGSMTLKQPNGENGDLKTPNIANIVYVKLRSGEVVAVHARWRSDGRTWDFCVCRLDGHGGWHEGRRVLARS